MPPAIRGHEDLSHLWGCPATGQGRGCREQNSTVGSSPSSSQLALCASLSLSVLRLGNSGDALKRK